MGKRIENESVRGQNINPLWLQCCHNQGKLSFKRENLNKSMHMFRRDCIHNDKLQLISLFKKPVKNQDKVLYP